MEIIQILALQNEDIRRLKAGEVITIKTQDGQNIDMIFGNKFRLNGRVQVKDQLNRKGGILQPTIMSIMQETKKPMYPAQVHKQIVKILPNKSISNVSNAMKNMAKKGLLKLQGEKTINGIKRSGYSIAEASK